MEERDIFNGKEFDVDGDTWVAEVENVPGASAQGTDLRVFMLVLRKKGTNETRRLKLLASHAGIHVENHIPLLYQSVRDFLRTGHPVGETQCF